MNKPESWHESELWIPYEQWFRDEPLQIVLDAEAEWLENAPDTYGQDAGEVWAGDIFPRLLTWELHAVDIEDMANYLPKFLDRMWVDISARSKIEEFRTLFRLFKIEG